MVLFKTGLPEAISVNEILSDKKLQAENRYVQVSETQRSQITL